MNVSYWMKIELLGRKRAEMAKIYVVMINDRFLHNLFYFIFFIYSFFFSVNFSHTTI